MTALPVTLALLLAAAPQTALDEARGHLEAGRIDDVLFALQGVTLEDPKQKAQAASVLAQTAEKSLAAKDDFMALQLAQMALGHDAAHPKALEIAAQVTLSQKQFGAAEDYAERWLKAAPKDPVARLFRAELAHGQGEPQVALDVLGGLDAGGLTPVQKALAERVRKEAAADVKAHAQSRAELSRMETQLERAAETAKKQRGPSVARASGRSNEVILYSTSWCGYCHKARAFLQSKGVSFVEKDIEKDADAAKELSQKRARAGIRSGGVPVIDVRGSLVLGFDQPKLEQLLD